MNLLLTVGRNVVDEPFGQKDSTTAIGLQFNGAAKWQTSQLTYNVGRYLQPSSLGGEIAVTQFRVQYSRSFTERFSGVAAVRAARINELGNIGTERTRAYGQLFVHYMVTKEIYLSTGYNFGWQQVPSLTTNAQNQQVVGPNVTTTNNGAFFTIGYQGNEPARF